MLTTLLMRAAATAVNGFTFIQTISADTSNYNLRNAAVAAGWDQVKPLIATVTINSGIVVSASTTSVAGFDTGSSIPAGSSLKLINNGYICGMGGRGGGNVSGAAQAGGVGLSASFPLAVTNNSIIAGGGGGGGAGLSNNVGGGGGRTGRTNTVAAEGSNDNGQVGTFSKGGDGAYAAVGGTTGPGVDSDGGGSGGGWGAAGGNGGETFGVYAAGAGGAAVSGNTHITWIAAGTRYGALT